MNRIFLCLCLFMAGPISVDNIAEISSVPAKVYHVTGDQFVGISSVDGQPVSSGNIYAFVAPVIQNLAIDGVVPVSGDAMGQSPEITASLSQSSGHLHSWRVTIHNADTQSIVESHLETLSGNPSTATVSYTPQSPLPEGDYQIFLSVMNNNLQSVTQNTTVVTVSTEFAVSDFGVGPNPYNPNNGDLTVGYQLTQPADVEWVLVSISGETIWKKTLLSGEEGAVPGYNTVTWDGDNRFDEMVATGPYILYVQFTSGADKVRKKTKVLVLK